MTIFFRGCPKCSCIDLRPTMYADEGDWKCFKCGLTEKQYDDEQHAELLKSITEITSQVMQPDKEGGKK